MSDKLIPVQNEKYLFGPDKDKGKYLDENKNGHYIYIDEGGNVVISKTIHPLPKKSFSPIELEEGEEFYIAGNSSNSGGRKYINEVGTTFIYNPDGMKSFQAFVLENGKGEAVRAGSAIMWTEKWTNNMGIVKYHDGYSRCKILGIIVLKEGV